MTKRNAEELVSKTMTDNEVLASARSAASAARWKAKYHEMANAALVLERQIEVLSGIPGKPNAKIVPRSLPKKKPAGVAVVVPASDWHVEERVDAKSTSNQNSFDLAEAEARIFRYYEKVLKLIDWQQHLAPVVELWHPLIGDLMSGYIHEELMESNSLSPTETCVFLQDMLCYGIDLLLKKTQIPVIIPTCVGNHGRTTQKMRIKTSYKNNYEWLLYTTLAKRYSNNGRVFWIVGQGYHNTQKIMGRKVRFHHGDGLRYMGGVGGISISVNKAIAQWDKVDSVDLDVFGHWHTFLWHYPKWVSCGSLMGYNEFSVAIKAEFQHPSQAFIVIDRDYGVTSAMPIFLTSAKRKGL